MTDKKLTDSEIVKAYEDKVNLIGSMTSVYLDEEDGLDLYEVMSNALDLINRLQVKKEYYKKNRDEYQDKVMFLSKQCDELQAENENLQSELKIMKDSNKNLKELYQAEKQKVAKAKQKAIDITKALKTAKAEAYEEFAEWLRAKSWETDTVLGFVKVVAREEISRFLKEKGCESREYFIRSLSKTVKKEINRRADDGTEET